LPQVGCAIKAELWDNVFLGGGARLAGFIRNDTPTTFIREAERQLRAGQHILIFPDGTRTASHTIGEFKSGFALIAKRAGAPIQTVIIESNSRFLGKGWPLFRRPAFPLVYHMRLGRRLAVDCEVHGFGRDLRDYFGRELGCGPR
jgi:1-acyl-sn-glycerol-3-phosphate acyltransferase